MKICRALERDPADERMLSHWSELIGASEKTVQRRFLAETGLTFSHWRTALRMIRAREMADRGMRQIDIALAVGYASEAAFVRAFKQHFAISPRRLKRAG